MQATVESKDNEITRITFEAHQAHETAQAEIKLLQDSYRTLEILHRELTATSESENQKLESELTEAKNSRAALSQEYEAAKERIHKLEASFGDTDSAFKATKDELDSLRNQLEATKNQISNLNDEKDETNLILTETKRNLSETLVSLEGLQKEKKDLEARLLASQEEINKLTENIRQTEKEKYGLEKNVEIYLQQIQEFKDATNLYRTNEKDTQNQIISLNKK